MPVFRCQGCGECCKRYYIISLPGEVMIQAKLKKMGEAKYIDMHMWFYLQFFPAKQSDDKICINAKGLPKKILKKIEMRLGFLPEDFIALPMLCFRRANDGSCTHLSSDLECSIYPARPLECELFPFISLKKDADYSKLYPFCEGLKVKGAYEEENPNSGKTAKTHFQETSAYFGEVKEKGFKKIWGRWPKQGVCLLEGNFLCKISEKDFFEAIEPFM